MEKMSDLKTDIFNFYLILNENVKLLTTGICLIHLTRKI